LIYAEGKTEDEWVGSHLWGFEMLDGGRRDMRRISMSNLRGEKLRAGRRRGNKISLELSTNTVSGSSEWMVGMVYDYMSEWLFCCR
jgi:hypothetical protein